MNLVEHYAAQLGLAPSTVFNAAGFLEGEDGWTVFRWNEGLLGPQPTSADLAAIAALPEPAPTVASLGPILLIAASGTCDALTAQIVPDETHKLAYANAATIAWGNGGKAPTADPAKTAFAALAASVGMQPDAFAAVAQEVSLVSLQLATALSTLRAAVASAKVVSDLSTALQAFEAAIAMLVTALGGAGLTVPVTAPAPITISGLAG